MRWVFSILGCALSFAQVTRAQDRPLLVVVEASPRDAEAIRGRIGEALARRVVSLLDDDATHAAESVSVAVGRDGRHARVCYRGRYETRFREVSAPADARGPSWVALAAVALVQEARALSWSATPEILDPFAEDEPRALLPLRLPTDVLDPWERQAPDPRAEPATGLGVPRPR